MPEPQPVVPVFHGADRDAAALRAAVERARRALESDLGLEPGSLSLDPQRAEAIGESTEQAAKLTAAAAAIARAVPGPVGKLLATLTVGAEKSPDTGKLRPGAGFPLNAAPSPIGYGQPNAFGLPPNFWLPTGATDVIPVVADELKLGIPEQRLIDQRLAMHAADADLQRLMVVQRRKTDDELRATLAKRDEFRGGFVGRLIAIGKPEDEERFFLAAQLVIAERANRANRANQLAAPAVGAANESDLVASLQALARLLSTNPPDP